MNINYTTLRSQLLDLPGYPAQAIMSPSVGEKYRELSDNYRRAAVMALIYKNEDQQDEIIIIERSNKNPQDKHAGQLSFPGGKYEEEDGDMINCALREVEEEIGVLSTEIKVLGNLSQLYVFASNFLVFPFVGVLQCKPVFTLQESEVASVITVPISQILDEGSKDKVDMTFSSGEKMKDVPYYYVNGKVLWGATAMIMSELEQILVKL